MTVKDRLKNFIKFKNLNNSVFCREVGVSSAFVSSMRVSIQPDKLESIALKYPELNIDWLLTGRGEMLLPDPSEQEIPSNNSTDLMELLREKDRQIDRILTILEKMQEK
ncbi:MAG: helix-turn-helix domain containing protein [Prevotellaceae bacterium]|jgi:hypothetical protein|nr:helix-turn-helix domain containing protein [Prevotellaceae bacterium]